MIYATIDVDLVDHPKAIVAGAAMYLWTWGMLWLRKHKENGFIPRETVLRCPWADRRINRMAAAKLAEVGLWLSRDDGWDVRNYALKNETRTEIEHRIDRAREKQKAYRGRQKQKKILETPSSARGETWNVTGNVPVYSGAGAGALSVGIRDQVQTEGGSKGGVLALPPRDGTTLTAPPDDIAVTDAMRAQCAMAGARPPQPEHVVQLLANARAKGLMRADWGAELVQWMIRQKNIDSRVGPGGGKSRTKQLPADEWVDDFPKEAAK